MSKFINSDVESQDTPPSARRQSSNSLNIERNIDMAGNRYATKQSKANQILSPEEVFFSKEKLAASGGIRHNNNSTQFNDVYMHVQMYTCL